MKCRQSEGIKYAVGREKIQSTQAAETQKHPCVKWEWKMPKGLDTETKEQWILKKSATFLTMFAIWMKHFALQDEVQEK
eukprot:1162135-Pelagomonas_calceolata.AAC.7